MSTSVFTGDTEYFPGIGWGDAESNQHGQSWRWVSFGCWTMVRSFRAAAIDSRRNRDHCNIGRRQFR